MHVLGNIFKIQPSTKIVSKASIQSMMDLRYITFHVRNGYMFLVRAFMSSCKLSGNKKYTSGNAMAGTMLIET